MKPRTALFATIVLGTIFVAGPIGMIRLNEALGWPRWEGAALGVLGGLLLLGGIGIAAYCSRLFSRVGEGTPVPIEPPKKLVVSGLYRYSRNPIYVAQAAILFGLFFYRGELALLLYAGLYVVVIQALIVGREEPELRDRFGEEYERYLQKVPRWVSIRTGGEG